MLFVPLLINNDTLSLSSIHLLQWMCVFPSWLRNMRFRPTHSICFEELSTLYRCCQLRFLRWMNRLHSWSLWCNALSGCRILAIILIWINWFIIRGRRRRIYLSTIACGFCFWDFSNTRFRRLYSICEYQLLSRSKCMIQILTRRNDCRWKIFFMMNCMLYIFVFLLLYHCSIVFYKISLVFLIKLQHSLRCIFVKQILWN